ncbi:MAG TPA: AmmeMemoRadiSam system radical SAM enzyme [Bacteroidales bacterium]|nr:AmmeMemoRadiSam system radical SAM enzyme [Bacteroidales bacterium]HPT21214.1 AmmeMemoRadiSam system radical SAM enzyme [Bacteroidales bacterium]
MIALFKEYDNYTECLLCPRYCKLKPGQTGACGVRKNNRGKIDLITYGVISGFALDPVEKKPLYHFFPGYSILSAGSYGCNMKCDFCQNYSISQNIPDHPEQEASPEKIIKTALSASRNIGIAFTYNEPVIWFEFMRDVAIAAKEKGLYTVMVSNGFVNSEPLNEIIQFIDAFNIDLKAFNNNFYKKLTGVDIEPVKRSLKQISKSGKHLEITTLVIPGQNDDKKEMALESEWIADELGKSVPLHLSRYFPMYKRDDPSTPQDTLDRLYDTASEKLDYVYMGNTNTNKGQNTSCPKCKTVVSVRSGYTTNLLNLDKEGKCTSCGTQVYSNFTLSLKKGR